MHQGAKSKPGWYYEKRRREKLGLPILARGRPRKPDVEQPKRPRGRMSSKQDLLYLARLHGWIDEDSINN